MITAKALYQAIDITWPAATTRQEGPWLIRQGKGGGSRVCATTLQGDLGDIDQAETAMRALGQNPLFMIRNGEDHLDHALESKGYTISKPVTLYAIPTQNLATEPPPPITCFNIWEPLQIMRDIWAQGGIDDARLDVMDRVKTTKTGLLGRLNDSPAAAAFVALDGNVAMLHALEVLPHQRRQGMAQYIMRAAGFWAQNHGAKYVSVLVTQDNTGANGLYHGLGMSPVAAYHYREQPET